MWTRLRLRTLARRLDRQLLDGAPVTSGSLLEAHRDRLGGLETRWRVAAGLRALLAPPRPPRRWSIPPRTERLDAARAAVEELIAVLVSTEPVEPRGVAMTMRLLSDGTGPLYAPRTVRSLPEELRACRAALAPAHQVGDRTAARPVTTISADRGCG